MGERVPVRGTVAFPGILGDASCSTLASAISTLSVLLHIGVANTPLLATCIIRHDGMPQRLHARLVFNFVSHGLAPACTRPPVRPGYFHPARGETCTILHWRGDGAITCADSGAVVGRLAPHAVRHVSLNRTRRQSCGRRVQHPGEVMCYLEQPFDFSLAQRLRLSSVRTVPLPPRVIDVPLRRRRPPGSMRQVSRCICRTLRPHYAPVSSCLHPARYLCTDVARHACRA